MTAPRRSPLAIPLSASVSPLPLSPAWVSRDDGELHEERRDERREGLYVITRQFQTARDLRVEVVGREVTATRRAGQQASATYSVEAFRWIWLSRADSRSCTNSLRMADHHRGLLPIG
jgi:hypothetical protein